MSSNCLLNICVHSHSLTEFASDESQGRLRTGQIPEIHYLLLSPKWDHHSTPSKVQATLQKSVCEGCERQKSGKSAMKHSLLDTASLLHVWIPNSCGYLHGLYYKEVKMQVNTSDTQKIPSVKKNDPAITADKNLPKHYRCEYNHYDGMLGEGNLPTSWWVLSHMVQLRGDILKLPLNLLIW